MPVHHQIHREYIWEVRKCAFHLFGHGDGVAVHMVFCDLNATDIGALRLAKETEPAKAVPKPPSAL